MIALLVTIMALAGPETVPTEWSAYTLATEGIVEWRSSKEEDWTTLNAGQWLPAKAQIRAGADAHADILFADNTVAAIPANTTYDIATRSAQLRPSKSGFWTALTRLLAAVAPGEEYGEVAAARGGEDLELILPVDIEVAGPSIAFRWRGGDFTQPYQIIITRPDGTRVLEWDCAEPQTVLTGTLFGMEPGKKYLWTVLQKDVPAPAPATFQLMPAKQAQKVENHLADLMKDKSALSPEAQSILRGLYYAGNHLDSDAAAAFGASGETPSGPHADLVQALFK